MKVTIKGIWRNTTDRQGKPLIGRNGQPYTKLSLKTQEHGDRYIYGFGNQDNARWNNGDIVEIEVWEDTYQDKQYLKFKMPKRTITREEFEALSAKVEALEKKVNAALSGTTTQINELEPDEEVPF